MKHLSRILPTSTPGSEKQTIGLVLSGGGSRAGYQVGALKALEEHLPKGRTGINVAVGSSLGAINTIVLSALLKHGFTQAIDALEGIWRARTYENTFQGSISRSFVRAMQIAILRYRKPGPSASSVSIFNPLPLQLELDRIISDAGGPDGSSGLEAVAVMTTVEGSQRKPLLLTRLFRPLPENALFGATFELLQLEQISAAHGLASAALPSVLPAVDLDLSNGQVRLVDGGICDNVPVDPAVRLGANELVVIDSSGRGWWFDRYGEPHYTRPKWEVPAGPATYCLCPRRSLKCVNISAMGPLLKNAVGSRTKDFLVALGPTWPIFKILKHKMGEDLAYEVMSYVALHPEYIAALIELGYNETKAVLARSGHFLTPVESVPN